MKLLFYIHGITGGGGERVLSTLVNEFSIRGEEVFLATDIHNSFAYDMINGLNCMICMINVIKITVLLVLLKTL